MSTNNKQHHKEHMLKTTSAFAILAGILVASSAYAQTATPPVAAQPGVAPISEVNEVVVTGTREVGRKALDSQTPIQVIGAQVLQATGETNVLDALKDVLPSLDTTYVQGVPFRAFSLDGLSPGETLILVNGKRRHLSSQLFKNAVSPYQGSDPVDLDLIPLSAIDHIEVLRDGAAAQYGTDAIAGVINIILKHSATGGTLSVLGGVTAAGDGATADISANQGFKLGDDGFINLSADYHHHDYTNRSGFDPRTNFTVRGKFNGDPKTDVEDIGYNAEKPLTPDITAYSFATFAHRYADTYEAYRLPTIAPSVFPNGFFPILNDDEYDLDVAVGLKGKAPFGWTWDLSTDFGRDDTNFRTIDTFNPTVFATNGSEQTSFYGGEFLSSSFVTNLDLHNEVATGLWAAPVSVAVGLEHRYETFEIGAGELNSYLDGGSQGSAGYSPAAASSSFRNIVAGYIDLSTHFTDHWQADVAGRVENYSDVGNGVTGKVSTRYDFSPLLGLRAAIDNGYHAPTLAQEHYASTSMTPTSGSAILPVDSVGAKSLGAPPLRPEKSTEYSVGAVSTPIPRMHITVDAYEIDIDNRIIETGALTGPLAQQALALSDITLPPGIPASNFSVNFFTNGVNTQTRGVDFTLDYQTDFGAWGSVRWAASANYNKTTITEFHPAPGVLAAAHVPLFTPTSISFLTTASPKTKDSVSATYLKDKWEVTLRSTYYDATSEMIDPVGNGKNFYKQSGSPGVLNDLSVSYRFTEALKLTVGGDNIFNYLPSKVPFITTGSTNTQIYPAFSPYGFNGGYYYVKFEFKY